MPTVNGYEIEPEAELAGADLRNSHLARADLSGANLTAADLIGANLSKVDLSYAWLEDAKLSGANLTAAYLLNAEMRGTELIAANLRDAFGMGVSLYRANLSNADLRDANLVDAGLSEANLTDANLTDANLRSADLSGADLRGKPGDLVFTSPNGGALRPNAFRKRVWAPAVGSADLAEPLPTPHALRHTAVAHWIAAGIEPYKLAKWAGHRSVATIYRLYGRLLDNDASSERDALSAIRAAAIFEQKQRGEVVAMHARIV